MISHFGRGSALAQFGLLLGLALSGAACSSGGGGGGGGAGGVATGPLTILSCSLGCSASTSGGGQISCGITDVFLNQEIRITFSKALDLGSVSNNSFQMVELSTGKTPPGSFQLDSLDPRVLVYRPQLTFDSTGNPIFGLTQGETYRLFLPGRSQGDLGPFIRSVGGEELDTRMLCTLLASRGIFDASPGQPDHTMTVTKVTSYDAAGNPATFADVPALGARDVYRQSEVRIVFDDLMNPATLVNPVTKTSNTITVAVDPDGNPGDSSDQVDVQGKFSITLDQSSLTTTVVFTPDAGFPSAGSTLPLRLIVVNLSTGIQDLGGNSLVQPGNTPFTPEVITFPVIDITETFDTTNFEDSTHSGSPWGNGKLLTGPGGGSGRLGDLRVPTGFTLVLDTDLEDFTDPLLQDPTVFDIDNVLDVGDPNTFTVTGGVFEFARLVVESGATLRFEGSNPARLFVRGEAIIQGEIDVSGLGGLTHDPTSYTGGIASLPGPGGGAGGDGGARPDGGNFTTLLMSDPTLDNPNDPGPVDPTDPAQYTLVNGQDGMGVVNLGGGAPMVAEGRGGLAWPQPMTLPAPYDLIHFPVDELDSLTSFPFDKLLNCIISAPGGVGSGGGYALSGFAGKNFFIGATLPPLVPDMPGGDSSLLGLDAAARTLDPDQGYLRGGSGGGGGGAHLLQTRVNGQVLNDCTKSIGGPLSIVDLQLFSGAAGGSGGGALQLQSGRRTVLNGVIDASGGNGGGVKNNALAQPGGGGSGGAILLQGPQVQIQPVPSRIDISGGAGGQGFDTSTPTNGASVGGDGGPGLLRIETFTPLLDPATEASKVIPTLSTLMSSYGASITETDILTTGLWAASGMGPSGFSGVQSCWFSDRDFVDPNDPTKPITNFFQLQFQDDSAGLGWDLMLKLKSFPNLQSYRGSNDLVAGMSLEEFFTNQLGTAPIIVRFQGAKVTGSIPQPCSVDLTGPTSPLFPGSLTGWVEHPKDLNTYHADPGLAPNIFRFAILWDANAVNFAEIEYVEDLMVRTQPD